VKNNLTTWHKMHTCHNRIIVFLTAVWQGYPKKFVVHLSFCLPLLQMSCAAQQTTTTQDHVYTEDLSASLPHFEAPETKQTKSQDTADATVYAQTAPSQTVNGKVDMVLDSLDKLNKTRKFIDGFTIQIYSGQSREEAIETKSKMVSKISDMEASLQYAQPKFRVTAGRYFSKLEAQKDLLKIRQHFANAILIPEKIAVE